MHPLLPQHELWDYCKLKSIILTGYSPLAKYRSELTEHPVLLDITSLRGRSAAQVLLGWLVQKGVVVVPKSITKERIEQNLHVSKVFYKFPSWRLSCHTLNLMINGVF